MKKIKVGDTVVAKHSIGKVVEINKGQVVIEVADKKSDSGIRPVKLTLKHAQTRGVTLEQLIEDHLIKVEIKHD